VRGVRIGLGSPSVLDAGSWAAITAGAGAGEGHLEWPIIKDVTNDIGYGEEDFPVNLPVGTEVRAQLYGVNDGNALLAMTLTVWLEDPDGVSRGLTTNTRDVYPGDQINGIGDNVTLDKTGDWIFHAKLEG